MKISVFPEQETLRPSPIMNDEAEKSTGEVEYIKKQSWNYPTTHPLGNYLPANSKTKMVLLTTYFMLDGWLF